MNLGLDTRLIVDWEFISSAESPWAELLALWARQPERRPEGLAAVAKRQRQIWESNCEHHNKNLRQTQQIRLRDWVILHDTKLDHSHSHKLPGRWNAPYEVTDVTRKDDRGTHRLAGVGRHHARQVLRQG